jgi:polysaccharide deacetylase 2 family uncharacterized protein YibQ
LNFKKTQKTRKILRKDSPESDARSTGLSFALIVCAVAVFILNQLSGVEGAKPPDQVLAPAMNISKIPEFEIYPKEDIRPKQFLPRPKISSPKAAIIIDDIGYDTDIADKLIKLDRSLTFSILPNAPMKQKIAENAAEKGIQIMLHLPMEPIEYPAANPGAGALFSSMSPDKMLAQLEHDLSVVPFVRGVNNHMGSKLTATSSPMYHLMSALKKRQMFFIDSVTTGDSRCLSAAQITQIPFAQRDVFLDNVQDAEAIRTQIRRLIHAAKEHGEAIGIGHPHSLTYQVLKEELPNLKKEIRLVPASELVHIVG